MKIDFCYSEYIDLIYSLLGLINPNEVKAIYIISSNNIIINLGANQWKDMLEQDFIKELTKTITHETLHYLLREYNINLNIEEYYCQLLSNQLNKEV